MKVLNKEQLKKAEDMLRQYFPQSKQVYGCVFMINRVDADPTDVLVDHWPDFNVLLIKPQRKETSSLADLFKDISIFTKDETSLRHILLRTDVFNWKQYLCLSIDLSHKEMIKSVAANTGVLDIKHYPCHMMTLQDPSNLKNERFPFQVSSLNESHVALVNSTWTFGMGDFSERFFRSMILNFPSCCVLDSDGQPVSWILVDGSCAMAVLYTLPEHRGKGYAKALVTILAKKLHSEGYPVYCFIELKNQPSYRLFTSLGFTAEPSYKHTWLDCYQASNTP